DADILGSVNGLYENLGMTRAYFSKLSPVSGTPLGHHPPPPEKRQGRLYQADWLLRKYGFNFGELPFDDGGGLPLNVDPKTAWAKVHPELFPVEVNTADKETLLRIPGIGHITAERLITERCRGKIRSAVILKGLGLRTSAYRYLTLDGLCCPTPENRIGQRKLPFE
ncbi:MAG: hypothetical protein GY771_08525, partial [bacterium]|nr:hypothetical protein [bacterium]